MPHVSQNIEVNSLILISFWNDSSLVLTIKWKNINYLLRFLVIETLVKRAIYCEEQDVMKQEEAGWKITLSNDQTCYLPNTYTQASSSNNNVKNNFFLLSVLLIDFILLRLTLLPAPLLSCCSLPFWVFVPTVSEEKADKTCAWSLASSPCLGWI